MSLLTPNPKAANYLTLGLLGALSVLSAGACGVNTSTFTSTSNGVGGNGSGGSTGVMGGGATTDVGIGGAGGNVSTVAVGGMAGVGGMTGVGGMSVSVGGAGGGHVDECALNTDNCHAEATCLDQPMGFICTCNAGYAGDGVVCNDVDECALNSDNCDQVATCTNVPGSFTCTCPLGFTDVNGDGTLCQPPVAGETCNTPIVIDPATLPYRDSGTTNGRANDHAYSDNACPGSAAGRGGASNDVVYSFTPNETGEYTFTVSGFDAALYVFTDCASVDNSCVFGVDDKNAAGTETRVQNLTAGTTYFIAVDGWSNMSNQAGNYALEIVAPHGYFDPIHADLTGQYTHDTVFNNGNGGIDPTQDSMDASGYGFMTRALAIDVGGMWADGLPDDGYFNGNGSHPRVQLGWNNADDGLNSFNLMAANDVVFRVPRAFYSLLQVYGSSTEGASTIEVTVTYTDGTTDLTTISFPDWFDDSFLPSNGFRLINGRDWYGNAGYENVNDPAIFGYSVNVDDTRVVQDVRVNQPTTNWFTFYGATGY